MGIWCKHLAYIVDSGKFGEKYYTLIGHDFMRRYNIKVDTKKKRFFWKK